MEFGVKKLSRDPLEKFEKIDSAQVERGMGFRNLRDFNLCLLGLAIAKPTRDFSQSNF